METITVETGAQGIAADEPAALTSCSFGTHANGAKKQLMAAGSSKKEGFSAVPVKFLISTAMSNNLAAGRCISSA